MNSTLKRTRSGAQFALTAIAATVASSFYTGAVFAQEQNPAAPAATENDQIETIVVTGSRLQRSEVEGALPVTTIDRKQIEATGMQTAADVLRSQTFNSFGSYQSQSGDSFSSNSQISLRGLGSDRTLVLIDGHRVPPSPVTGAAGIDLNTIPLAAIERVEILQDGASAIYGSDAIGGVVNIIMRKDINETIVTAEAGRPTRKGGDENSASIVSGKSTENGHILFGLSWQDKKHIALKDRSYSSFFPGDGHNFSTIRGANEVGNTLYGYSSYTYYAAPSCAPDRVYNYDIVGPGNKVCIYPFANVAWDLTDLRTTSMFANGDQKINDWASVFFQANYSRVESAGRFAPVADAVFLDADAAANPLDEPAILLHRFEQLGPRNNIDTNTVLDVLFGARVNAWGVPIEVGYHQSRYNSTDIGRNYTNRGIARQYLSDGTYNPYDPSKNSADVINAMKATIGREGLYKYQEGYINATFSPVTLPAGELQVAVGAETRRDRYYDIYDALSEAGQVGGSAGNSAAGNRYASAGYVELLVPVFSSLEFDGALRYDKYGDFGDATTGKISVRYHPIDMLTVRGSYGTGFRAPSLSELYGAVSNDAPRIRDLTQCRDAGISDANCVQTQVNTGVDSSGKLTGGFQGSNPDLLAEKSDQYSAGFVLTPTKWIDVSVDYYNIKVEDAIQFIDYQELIRREANGQSLPPGTSIERVPTSDGSVGRIIRITTGPANVATLKTSGIDLDLNTHFNVGFGKLEQKLAVSYVLEYKDTENKQGQDQVGDEGTPEYRVNLFNNLAVGPFTFAYNVSYIDSTAALLVPDASGKQQQQGHVASFIMHDVQATWLAPTNTELTIGCRNIFDKGPSTNFTGLDNPYYNNELYNPYGRVPYVSIKQTF